MKSVTLSSKYQVVIPSSARKKLGVHSGDKLIITRVTDTEVTLRKEPSYHDLVGTVPSQKTDAVQRVRTIRDTWK